MHKRNSKVIRDAEAYVAKQISKLHKNKKKRQTNRSIRIRYGFFKTHSSTFGMRTKTEFSDLTYAVHSS